MAARHGKVLFGGVVTGKTLVAHALIMEWNQPRTLLSFSERSQGGWTSEFRAWRFGGYGYRDGSWGPVDAVWPLADVDPLQAAKVAIDGGLWITGETDVNFCGQCGAARVPTGRFCGSCGASFPGSESKLTSRELLNSIARAPGMAGPQLMKLVEAAGSLNDMPAEARRLLMEYITADFSEAQVVAVDEADEPDTLLTLRKAQQVQDSLLASRPLSNEEVTWARLLLIQAPFAFGYWGAQKALLKFGPIPGLEVEHGVALGRLNKANASLLSVGSPEVQNLSVLTTLARLPQRSTINYMRRRTRRGLQALGQTDPSTYALVCEALLQTWDEPMHPNAFAPAFVMRGEQGLRPGSRLVYNDPWWGPRSDPYPQVWDSHLKRIETLFDQVAHSPELLAWSYQVLDSLGRAPRVTPKRLHLALLSPFAPLWEEACALAVDTPESLLHLDARKWQHLLQQSPLDLVRRVVEAFLGLGNAGRRWESPEVLGARRALESLADVHDDAARLEIAARMYLLAGGWSSQGRTEKADVTALCLFLTLGGLPQGEDLNRILSRVSLNVILEVLRRLENLSVDVQELLTQHVLRNVYSVDISALVRANLEFPLGWQSSLLWQVIDRRGGFDYQRWTISQGIQAATPTREGLATFFGDLLGRLGPQRLPEVVELFHGSGVSLPAEDVVEALLGSSGGKQALWLYLAPEVTSEVADVLLGSNNHLDAFGDSLGNLQAMTTVGNQTRLLVAYMKSGAPRVQRDVEFLLAAARNIDVRVQQEAINGLIRHDHMSQAWLLLAEGALPSGLAAARSFLDSIRDRQKLTHTILACLDSRVEPVRAMGLELLKMNQPLLDREEVWLALAESDEPAVQRLVAEEALVRGAAPGDFDRRVLTARRKNRGAKEAVQSRWAAVDVHELVDEERVAALMSMARSVIKRDREWALTRIARLSSIGVEVPGVSVSAVSESVR